MKNTIIGLLILLIIGGGAYLYISKGDVSVDGQRNYSDLAKDSEYESSDFANSDAKQYLSVIRPFTEFYYDDNGNYEGVCEEKSVKENYTKASQTTSNKVICNDSTDGWAIEVELIGGSYFCVDLEDADTYAESSISGSRCVIE